MRTSTGLISRQGVYSVSPLLDSVGAFARSAIVLERVIDCMIDSSTRIERPISPLKRYKLLYPTHAKGTEAHRWFPFPSQSCEGTLVEQMFEKNVRALEAHLGCQRIPFNIDALWQSTRPPGQSESLDIATGSIYSILTTYCCVRETVDPFIADFKAANNGRAPFIDPNVKMIQQYGRNTTAAEFQSAVESALMFSKWVREAFFFTIDPASGEEAFPLLVFPQSWGRPSYRDEANNAPPFFSSFSAYSLSYLSGCPDCTVPIGEVPTISRHTEVEMMLPVSLSVLSPPMSDLTLLNLLAGMEKEGVLRAVKTGRTMYD